MIKVGGWFALTANLAIIVSIAFLAVELRHNTRAIEAQTRDSITAKEIEVYGWMATNRDLAEVVTLAFTEGVDTLDPVQLRIWTGSTNAHFREWRTRITSTDLVSSPPVNLRLGRPTSGT